MYFKSQAECWPEVANSALMQHEIELLFLKASRSLSVTLPKNGAIPV